MKKNSIVKALSLVTACLSLSVFAPCHGQRVAVKANVAYGLLEVPNAGAEFALSPRTTLDVWGAYNPFQESETRKWKLWAVQPEFRYWMCRNFAGLFAGFHAGAGQYNFGGSPDLGLLGEAGFTSLKEHRVQGTFWDAGFSFGRHWILSPRWGMEATVGLGYAGYSYKRFRCRHCGEETDSGKGHYFGPTRAGISLVYLLK